MLGDRKFHGKFLVLGTNNHVGQVDSYEWTDKRINQLNLNEYHTIIVNFNAIPLNQLDNDFDRTKIYAQGENGNFDGIGDFTIQLLINLNFLDQSFQNKLGKAKTNLILITGVSNKFNFHLFSDNLMIPKNIADEKGLQYSKVSPKRLPDGSQLIHLYYEFFNCDLFSIKHESNITMVNPNELVAPYFDEYQDFDFVFSMRGIHTPLAHTFYNDLLSFTQEIKGIHTIILPHPKLTLPFDVDEKVLRSIIKLRIEEHLAKPEWLNQYTTKRQSIIEEEISEVQNQINFLKQQINEKQAGHDLIGEFQRVLYTSGDIMRESIMELFKAIEIEIQVENIARNHDFEIDTPKALIVVQIQTLDGPNVTRKTLRQLNQWVEEREEQIKFSKEVKGLSIINYQIKTDPSLRDVIEMDQTTESYLQKNQICLMTTDVLFRIFSEIYENKSKPIDFFIEQILKTTGIYKFQI